MTFLHIHVDDDDDDDFNVANINLTQINFFLLITLLLCYSSGCNIGIVCRSRHVYDEVDQIYILQSFDCEIYCFQTNFQFHRT